MASESFHEFGFKVSVGGQKPPGERVSYSDLSASEQRIVDAYSLLVDELFLFRETAAEEKKLNPTSREFQGNIKRFLKMFVAIYCTKSGPSEQISCQLHDASVSDLLGVSIQEETKNANILELCINKFRNVYRRHHLIFRYMSSGCLREAHKKAERKAMETLKKYSGDQPDVSKETEVATNPNYKGVEDDNTLLKIDKLRDIEKNIDEEVGKVMFEALHDLIKEESAWIEKINICRRTDVTLSIQEELLKEFKEEIQVEFGLLYGTSKTDFYDSSSLQSRYTEMLESANQDFVQQIAFQQEEDASVIDQLTSEFKDTIHNNVIDDLLEKNVKNINNVKSTLNFLVGKCVDTYKENMSSFVKSDPSADHLIFLKYHEELKSKNAPEFSTVIVDKNVDSVELEVKFTNQYQKQIHDTFAEIIKNAAEDAYATFQKRRLKIVADLTEYSKSIYQTFNTQTAQCDKLRQMVEDELVSMMEEAEGNSLKNVKNIEYLVDIATPKVILTSAERLRRDEEIDTILKRKKQEYVDTMSARITTATYVETAQRHHQDVKETLTSQLKTIFTEKFGVDEPSDSHVTTFHLFIDNHWNQKRPFLPIYEPYRNRIYFP